MILLNDFFTINDSKAEGNRIIVTLTIDAGHKIFEGHFPGQPVVPGVCMLQIVKEITQKSINHSIRLKKSEHLKFLAVIDPLKNPSLTLDLTYQNSENDTVAVVASLFYNEITFFKFKGTFTKE